MSLSKEAQGIQYAFGKPFEKVGMPFKACRSIIVADGTKTRFWLGTWCGDCPLKGTFQHFLVLITFKMVA